MRAYQPKHMAPVTYASWKSTPKGRVFTKATAAIMAGLLAMPGTAFAATDIAVGENWYDQAASGAGSQGGTWSWDGANDMVLDNYNGDSIQSVGQLDIDLVGNNTITVDNSASGDPSGIYGTKDDDGNGGVTVQGDGNLTIKSDDESLDSAYGIHAPEVTIDGADVLIDLNNSDNMHSVGIQTTPGGDVNIINDATVNINASGSPSGSTYWGAIDAWSGDVNITGSRVNVNATEAYGIFSYGSNDVNITNSIVTAAGQDHAIFSSRDIHIQNSDIAVTTTEAPSDNLTAQATGSSKGAGIAAAGTITLNEVNLVGATVQKDDSTGLTYVANADGSSSTVAMKHTGESSEFPGNGKGSRQSTPATGGRAAATTKRLASTGGEIEEIATAVTAVTGDPTTAVPFFTSLVGGAGSFVAGLRRRRRAE